LKLKKDLFKHMAQTFYGIGTTFYGKRDFRSDGSFLTTEWLSFIYFPVYPFPSLRVRYQGPAERSIHIGVGRAEKYAVYEKTSPNWKQVLCVYGYATFVVGWVFSIIILCASTKDATLALTLLFVGCLLPVTIPWILRQYARRQLSA
jgi:hypothetical protein